MRDVNDVIGLARSIKRLDSVWAQMICRLTWFLTFDLCNYDIRHLTLSSWGWEMHVLVAPMWEVSALGVFKRVCLDLPRVFEETVGPEKQHIYTWYIWYNCRGSLSTMSRWVGIEHEKCQCGIENAEAKHPKLGAALTWIDARFVECCM